MTALLAWIRERGGEIVRFPGGFWTVEPWGQKTWGTSSVEALVKRGVLEYSEWKENRNGRFPIRARIIQPNSVIDMTSPDGTKPTSANVPPCVKEKETR
jgi:hypothetical protein